MSVATFAFLQAVGGRSLLNPDSPPPASVEEAVREHLVVLLNTRQGTLEHLPDYGMPDVSSFYGSAPESLELLGAAIREVIARYEPRIEGLKVELEEVSHEGFGATYRIEGVVVVPGGESRPVAFHTRVTSSGFTKVER